MLQRMGVADGAVRRRASVRGPLCLRPFSLVEGGRPFGGGLRAADRQPISEMEAITAGWCVCSPSSRWPVSHALRPLRAEKRSVWFVCVQPPRMLRRFGLDPLHHYHPRKSQSARSIARRCRWAGGLAGCPSVWLLSLVGWDRLRDASFSRRPLSAISRPRTTTRENQRSERASTPPRRPPPPTHPPQDMGG